MRKKTLIVERTTVCWATNVGAVWQVLFCFKEHEAEADGEQGRGLDAPLLDATEDFN